MLSRTDSRIERNTNISEAAVLATSTWRAALRRTFGGNNARRIQKICNARERYRPRGWRHHRCCFWYDRDLLSRGHTHACHRSRHRGPRFPKFYPAASPKVQPGLSYVDAKKQGAVLGWGQFLTIALNFLIIAWVLFLAIKGINRLKKEEPPAPSPGPTPEVKLLTEIRDVLKGGSLPRR